MLVHANVVAESKEFDNRVTRPMRFPNVRRKRLISSAVSGTQVRDELLNLDISALPPAPKTLRGPEGQRSSNDDFGELVKQAVREVSRRLEARYDKPTQWPLRFLHMPPY